MSEKKQRNNNGNISFNVVLIKCLIYSLICFIIYVISTLIISKLTLNSEIISNNVKVILFILIGIASFLNGTLCALKINIKAIVSSFVSAAIFATLVFIFYGIIGNFGFTVNSIITLSIIYAVTVVTAVLTKNIKN